MAPQRKVASSTNFVYDQNNFVTCVAIAEATTNIHPLMQFLSEFKVSKALLEAPTIVCNVVEEFWKITLVSNDLSEVTFMCKGNEYKLTSLILRECLELPCNNCDAMPDETHIKNMRKSVNYTDHNANLGKIVRQNSRKEWIYFFDTIIKVFSGKISNFDAITTSMQQVAYNILFIRYFDLSNILLIELYAKLGFNNFELITYIMLNLL